MVHLVAAAIVQAVYQEEVEAGSVLEVLHAAEAVAVVHLEDNY